MNVVPFSSVTDIEKHKIYNGLVGIGIYLVGATIFMSPVGEFFFRATRGLKRIDDMPEFAQLKQAFDEVYARATAKYGDLPKGIKLYLQLTGDKNAAALGRKTIFFTQGILALPIEDLNGVMAHELAHLYNGDTVILLFLLTGNVIINIIASIIKTLLYILGLAGLLFGGDDSRAGRLSSLAVILLGRLIIDGIVGLWTLIGVLMRNITSKQVEFEADEFACSIGYGKNLANALLLIDQTGSQGARARQTLLDKALSSHPETHERVRRCNEYAYA
jgi:Zn-dependent protease with chaperone function